MIITSVDEDGEKLNPSPVAGGNGNGAATVQQLSGPSVTHRVTISPSPREINTHVHMKTCTQMLTAALFVIVKRWKQDKLWINWDISIHSDT